MTATQFKRLRRAMKPGTWNRAKNAPSYVTQKELASILGTSCRNVQNWEQGRYPIPAWLPSIMRSLSDKLK